MLVFAFGGCFFFHSCKTFMGTKSPNFLVLWFRKNPSRVDGDKQILELRSGFPTIFQKVFPQRRRVFFRSFGWLPEVFPNDGFFSFESFIPIKQRCDFPLCHKSTFAEPNFWKVRKNPHGQFLVLWCPFPLQGYLQAFVHDETSVKHPKWFLAPSSNGSLAQSTPRTSPSAQPIW